jgi:hypothetical protein
MSQPTRLSLRCPDCGSDLVIDSKTGEILFHQKAKDVPAEGKSFDALFADMESRKGRADEIFERERGAMKDRDRLLNAKFQEALKRAEEEPDQGRPLRPFDLD